MFCKQHFSLMESDFPQEWWKDQLYCSLLTLTLLRSTCFKTHTLFSICRNKSILARHLYDFRFWLVAILIICYIIIRSFESVELFADHLSNICTIELTFINSSHIVNKLLSGLYHVYWWLLYCCFVCIQSKTACT